MSVLRIETTRRRFAFCWCLDRQVAFFFFLFFRQIPQQTVTVAGEEMKKQQPTVVLYQSYRRVSARQAISEPFVPRQWCCLESSRRSWRERQGWLVEGVSSAVKCSCCLWIAVGLHLPKPQGMCTWRQCRICNLAATYPAKVADV